MAEPITVSITRTVDPHRAAEVAAWARAGQDLLAASPGYLGSGWVRSEPDGPQWHMLFRFADRGSLDAWERSPERAWWVASAQDLVAGETQQRRTGIEGWFDEPATVEVIRDAPAAPPRWKQMVAIFVAFYPLSLLANWLLGFVTAAWPLPLRVLVLVLCVTPVMTYFALPLITRALRPWLQRGLR
jgi:uncharacterized protein